MTEFGSTDARRRWRWYLAAGVGVVVVLAGIVMFAMSRPNPAPPVTVLEPLPDRARIVANARIPAEGSLEQDERVVVIAFEDGIDFSTATGRLLTTLEAHGWERSGSTAAVHGPSGACAGFDPIGAFLEDPDRGDRAKEVVGGVRSPAPSSVVVSLTYC